MVDKSACRTTANTLGNIILSQESPSSVNSGPDIHMELPFISDVNLANVISNFTSYKVLKHVLLKLNTDQEKLFYMFGITEIKVNTIWLAYSKTEGTLATFL